jgi:hypothetical protein
MPPTTIGCMLKNERGERKLCQWSGFSISFVSAFGCDLVKVFRLPSTTLLLQDAAAAQFNVTSHAAAVARRGRRKIYLKLHNSLRHTINVCNKIVKCDDNERRI